MPQESDAIPRIAVIIACYGRTDIPRDILDNAHADENHFVNACANQATISFAMAQYKL